MRIQNVFLNANLDESISSADFMKSALFVKPAIQNARVPINCNQSKTWAADQLGWSMQPEYERVTLRLSTELRQNGGDLLFIRSKGAKQIFTRSNGVIPTSRTQRRPHRQRRKEKLPR